MFLYDYDKGVYLVRDTPEFQHSMWCADGTHKGRPGMDLISEWEEETMGPVRMKPVILPGRYGIVTVLSDGFRGTVRVAIDCEANADELEAASKVLAALAGVVRG